MKARKFTKFYRSPCPDVLLVFIQLKNLRRIGAEMRYI